MKSVQERKQIGRVAALIVLVALAALSLRGYLPDVDRTARRPAADSRGTVVAVCLLLAASVAILVFAFVATVRGKHSTRPPVVQVPERGRIGSVDRRWVLAVLVAFTVAVIVVLALGPLRVGTDTQSPGTAAPSTTQDNQSGSAQPAPQPATPTSNTDLLPIFTATTAVMIGIFIAGVVVVARRSRSLEPAPTNTIVGQSDSPSDTLARVAALGLAEVAEPGREPRAAIIACYLAMERGLAEAPDAAPLESDTPSEVLARAVDHGVLHSDAASHLVSLFTEARFSPHEMTEVQRQSAESLLRQVLDDIGSPAWSG
ncbi:DUF4129 domain-containing protein [Antrihabitans cavernicola]|uniref:DUF4129 domain-containing protein n=1 Tax=Antrihabitans cavernicola TaxID=2495913 RepID=A0A5A7S7V9_9NOCA|nr:DUF4129 domain-containing protein [Spelaeibacter cavernicola]KAA0021996.1 DUF4129 domain-containing protein [Spelaeibacter cavernicola]